MRLAGQSPRDWALAIGGGLLLALGLVAWLRPDSFAATPPTTASAPVAPPPNFPPPPSSAVPPPAVPAAVAVADLQLHGLIQRPGAAAAIIGRAGRQRLVRVGAVVVPGLTLARITPRAAVLSGPQGEVLLGFPGEAPATAATPVTSSATTWRLALQPVRTGGGITGWQLVNPALVPLLALAGLRAGDIITDINGEALFSEEKILELPQQLAGNPAAEIGFRRDGRRLSARPGRPPA